MTNERLRALSALAVAGALDDIPNEERFTEFEGIAVDITVRNTTPATFASHAERGGLRVHEPRVREPYESAHTSRRIQLLAGT